MALRIAQISDLHFGRDVTAVTDALLADLRTLAPTWIAVCGDLTQRATATEFRAARAFLDALPAPALVVPGNHDLPGWRLWSRFTRPWHAWRQHLGPEAAFAAADGLTAVGINTARRWGPHHDWSRGRIDATQLAAARTAFDAAPPGDLRVLIAHHPFLLTEAGRRRGLVGRADTALQHLHRRADLLLGGHIHLAYSGVVRGLVVAQSGTAVSNRLKGEPNSFNLISATDDRRQLTVETRRFAGDAFDTHSRADYLRGDDGWTTA